MVRVDGLRKEKKGKETKTQAKTKGRKKLERTA